MRKQSFDPAGQHSGWDDDRERGKRVTGFVCPDVSEQGLFEGRVETPGDDVKHLSRKWRR